MQSLTTVVQVRFTLTSSPVFSRTDTVTDSKCFYNFILDLFDDTDEKEEVNDLLAWWNRYLQFLFQLVSAYISHRQIFPVYSLARHPICKNSALARIKERRVALKERTNV
jgi:hypothetical protein